MTAFSTTEFGEMGKASSEALRSCAGTLLRLIDTRLVDGREKSLAKTKLEECVMWAERSIATSGVTFGADGR